MNSKQFLGLMDECGLKVVGKSGYGLIGKFPVLVTYVQGRLVNVSFSVQRDSVTGIKKEINQALKGIGRVFQLNKDNLIVQLSVGTKKFVGKYQELSEAIQTVLREHSVQPSDTCPYCQSRNCDVIGRHEQRYQAMHQSCLTQQIAARSEKADKNLNEGSYFMGLLGGLLGGLIACIPSFLSIWFVETAYSLLYALIPLGVYYGYKLFKGKMSRGAIGITIVLSVILSLSIDIIVLTVALITEGIPLGYLPLLLSDAEFFGEYVYQAFVSLLFVGAGIYITWNRISKTAHSELENSEEILETVRPLQQV